MACVRDRDEMLDDLGRVKPTTPLTCAAMENALANLTGQAR